MTQGMACNVHSVVTNQWPGGFRANITIKNAGTTPWTNWTLKCTFANGQTITQLWNGRYTQTGSPVTVTNLSSNGSLEPGATVSPGLNGTWSNTNPNPTVFTLNDTTCSLN